jgi:hypothetical protein
MTDNCNSDLIATARANVAARQTPANGRAIMRGEWDGGTLVQGEVERLLREPIMMEEGDD